MRHYSLLFPRLPLYVFTTLAGISCQLAQAAEQPANAGLPLHFNVAGGNSFNSLPALARRDLLIPPADESQPQPQSKHGRRDWNGERGRNCESLEQQYRGALSREPMITPDFYPNAELSRTYPGEPDRTPNGARPGVPNPDYAQNNRTWLDSLISPRFEALSASEKVRARYGSACSK